METKNKLYLRVLAQANLFNNGRAFCIVQRPDWNGGHFYHAYDCTAKEYEENYLHDFEYIVWAGTPAEYAEQMPAFVAHCEPLHEEPEDYWQTFFGVPRPRVSTNKLNPRYWWESYKELEAQL